MEDEFILVHSTGVSFGDFEFSSKQSIINEKIPQQYLVHDQFPTFIWHVILQIFCPRGYGSTH